MDTLMERMEGMESAQRELERRLHRWQGVAGLLTVVALALGPLSASVAQRQTAGLAGAPVLSLHQRLTRVERKTAALQATPA